MRSGFVRFHPALEPLMDSIEAVLPHPVNPRNGDVDAIIESIRVNGFIAPVIAQKSTGHIIAGNHRYYALMELGASQIPVVWLDVDDIEAKRYLLADNRTSDLGQYDTSQLLGILNELIDVAEGDMQALLGTGYTESYLTMLTELDKMENEPTADFAQWPTITMQVPPHIKKIFMEMTKECDEDRDRLELLLRLAGWDGKK